jgi:hypothetical protein
MDKLIFVNTLSYGEETKKNARNGDLTLIILNFLLNWRNNNG